MADETQVHDDSAEQENPRCTVCDRPKNNHPFRHPFSDPKHPIGASQIFGKTQADRTGGSGRGPAMDRAQIVPEVQVTQMPFDPVLRQALVDKGVLTVEDLNEADRKIRAVSGMFAPLSGIEVRDGG